MADRTDKRSLSLLIAAAGLLMIAAAFALVVHNYAESNRAGAASADAVNKIRSAMDSVPQSGVSPPSDTVKAQKDGTDFTETEAADLPAAADHVEIDGKRYIGILSVPSLVLELPVQETCSESGLKQSPCLYSGTPKASGCVIAGHSYKTHFGPLSRLSPGDEILFMTVSGDLLTYTVDCVEALKPWQTEDMISGDWALTLFTCTASGNARLAVRCNGCD